MNGAGTITLVDLVMQETSKPLGVPTITSSHEIVRPSGYVIPGITNHRVSVQLGALSADGWGSGGFSVAKAKAVSEAYERVALLHTRGGVFGSKSSNGWAAHRKERLALENAVAELIERDCAVQAWLGNGHLISIPRSMWPSEIATWETLNSSEVEFGNPEVFLSVGPFGAAGTVLLKASDGCAVTGHASGKILEDVIRSAFFEALRSAHGALQFDSISEVTKLHSGQAPHTEFSPGANAYAYAYGVPLPALDVVAGTCAMVTDDWNRHCRLLQLALRECEHVSYEVGDRIVVQARIRGMRDMFWGPTPIEMGNKNTNPHFVG